MSASRTRDTIRLIQKKDAAALSDLLESNREFLQPWEPERSESYFTEEGQSELIEESLQFKELGSMVPLVILNQNGDVAGRLTLNTVVRGALQSASLGYWVGEEFTGNGLATRAVGEAVQLATEELDLHRLQAETLEENEASQQVLEKNGFSRFGLAPQYLKINGAWRDHLMYQRILGEGN